MSVRVSVSPGVCVRVCPCVHASVFTRLVKYPV